MRGHNPNWTACRAREKAPVITACEAMIVAIVARITSGYSQPGDTIR